MNKQSLLLVGTLGALLPGAVLFACATDNGDSVHGPQFGPTPERPDGQADGPVTPSEGGPNPRIDGGSDAAAGDSAPPPTCTSGTVAVLAGGDVALTAALQDKGGAWSGTPIAGGAARSAPSLVAFGTGFTGLTRGPADALQAVSYGATWSAATSLGANLSLSSPTLAVFGTKVEAVILDATPGMATLNKFYRVENSGASWGTAADPVMPPAGAQSFGPSAAALAAAGTDLVFAQDGSDQGLYAQTYTGTWSTAVAILGAGTAATASASPALVNISGAHDLVLLYADNTANHVIGFATRSSAAGHAWSTATVTQATAQTAEAISAVSVSATTILVTFRGNNQRPYFMTGTVGATTVTWSVPAALLPDTSTVDSPPAVAKGVCGDDAIAVYASAGQVKATRYRGGAWSVPETVIGASGNRVSVATR